MKYQLLVSWLIEFIRKNSQNRLPAKIFIQEINADPLVLQIFTDRLVLQIAWPKNVKMLW